MSRGGIAGTSGEAQRQEQSEQSSSFFTTIPSFFVSDLDTNFFSLIYTQTHVKTIKDYTI